MADNNMNKSTDSMKQDERNQKLRSEANQTDNQPMRHEQAKGAVSGEQGQRGEKSAIGGGSGGSQQPSGQTGNQPGGSQTGEPGRARSELDQSQERKGEFDKSRSETGSR